MIFAFLRKSPFYDRGLEGEEYGLFNGYVAFDAELPETFSWEGECLDCMVAVHGGLTFDRIIKPEMELIPVTEIPSPELWKEGIRCVGFDTAHIDDNAKIWNYQSVRDETLSLLEQIKRLIAERSGC